MPEPVLEPVRSTFRALARTIVPEAATLDEGGWREVEAIVEASLASRPPALRRQLRLLIRALEWLPVARYARPFRRLDARRRARFLATVQDAPVLAVRRGFWGLRTLVFMGYYGRPEAAAGIGWHGDPRGWEARR
jgi:hypothetical protein